MHVLQVSWEYPPRLYGGLGRHVEGLVGALDAAGTQVTLVTPHLEPAHGDEGAPTGRVSVLRAPTPPLTGGQHWTAAVIAANNAMAQSVVAAGVTPDVVHVHDWMVGHAGAILAADLGIPIVATVHATERGRHMGHLPDAVSRWVHKQERALVAVADRVAVCAAGMAKQATEWLGADSVTVIRPGVDLHRWQTRHDRQPTKVVVAGRLEFEKGVHILLAATAGQPMDVHIAGDGTYGEALKRMAEDAVTFHGHLTQPALADLLATAAVVVVPSLVEPFGLIALEAMAAGAPVIASGVGGLIDIVDGAGVCVPPDDPIALRTALLALLADHPRRRSLTEAGRLRAKRYAWTAAAAQYADLYTSALADHTR